MTFFEALDGEAIRPMLDVSWAPLLGAFSVLFEEHDDEYFIGLCLEGFIRWGEDKSASSARAGQIGYSTPRPAAVAMKLRHVPPHPCAPFELPRALSCHAAALCA